jgi:hypothetical protein
MLSAGLLMASAAAWGQTGLPAKPDSSIKPPADPGIRRSPDSPMQAPSNSGVIVVPPKTDPEAITTPPKNVDPEIDDVTKDIDRKNRQKSEDKQKSH